MFTLVRKNGDRIPMEDWIVLAWCSGHLADPFVLQLFQEATRLEGNWKALRDKQLSSSKPG